MAFNSHLDRTLSPSPVFQAREIAVAVALPLEKWHFFLERHVQTSLLETLGMSRDFVRNNLHPDWQKWWSSELEPALSALRSIGEIHGVTLIPHATLKSLRSIAAQRQTRLLFLVAHHPPETDEIELYEGLVSWDEIVSVFSGLTVVLMVCGSGAWAGQLREKQPLPAGGVMLEMPVREGCIYLQFLLKRLIGGTALDVAQHEARRDFLNRGE